MPMKNSNNNIGNRTFRCGAQCLNQLRHRVPQRIPVQNQIETWAEGKINKWEPKGQRTCSVTVWRICLSIPAMKGSNTFPLHCSWLAYCWATKYFALLSRLQTYLALQLKCPYFCPVLTKSGVSELIFVRAPVPNFKNIRPVGPTLIHAGRQADRRIDRWTDRNDGGNRHFCLFMRKHLEWNKEISERKR
jgi:hypothetical protein